MSHRATLSEVRELVEWSRTVVVLCERAHLQVQLNRLQASCASLKNMSLPVSIAHSPYRRGQFLSRQPDACSTAGPVDETPCLRARRSGTTSTVPGAQRDGPAGEGTACGSACQRSRRKQHQVHPAIVRPAFLGVVGIDRGVLRVAGDRHAGRRESGNDRAATPAWRCCAPRRAPNCCEIASYGSAARRCGLPAAPGWAATARPPRSWPASAGCRERWRCRPEAKNAFSRMLMIRPRASSLSCSLPFFRSDLEPFLQGLERFGQIRRVPLGGSRRRRVRVLPLGGGVSCLTALS